MLKTNKKNDTILVYLPNYLTNKLQPLDKWLQLWSCKNYLDIKLSYYGKSTINLKSSRLSKSMFVQFLEELWNISIKPRNIISGFINTGIFLLDKIRVPESEVNTSDVEQ